MESLTIELPALASAALWVGTGLLGIIATLGLVIAWFLRREIRNNDATHAELRRSVDKLLEGDVGWVQILMTRTNGAQRDRGGQG